LANIENKKVGSLEEVIFFFLRFSSKR